MKNRIFMYLFLFSVLLIVFQYVNSKNIIDKFKFNNGEFKKLKYKNISTKLMGKISIIEPRTVNSPCSVTCETAA